MDYKIVEKPAFEIAGKSKIFTHDNFFKGAPKFWKEYVCTEEYQRLWSLTNGKWGQVTEAPLMSVYLPNDKGNYMANVKGNKDSFLDILGIENTQELDPKEFMVFKIPPATYAEFYCTYQTSVKINKFIYGEWLPSTGYERDEQKPDIAAYFPVAFMSTKGMRVRWWIPVTKKK
jgi:AraC family transcriptional regulator